MYCVKCGKEIKDGDRFCSNCGEPVARQEEINVSKEHIPLNWDMSAFKSENSEVKEATFDWGDSIVGYEKRETPNGLMFQDRELVERATAELDLGDVRRRAQDLRDGYEKIKESEESHTELKGFSSTVNDMSEKEFKSVKELEEELFGSYVEEEPEKEEAEVEEVVEETTTLEETYVEEELEKEDVEEVIEESTTSEETYVEEEPEKEEVEVEEVVEEIFEEKEIQEEQNLSDELIEEDIEDNLDEKLNETSDEEELEDYSFKKSYSNEEREDIDDYLEKTIIYNRGDIEKKIEEERIRLEEEKRRAEEEKLREEALRREEERLREKEERLKAEAFELEMKNALMDEAKKEEETSNEPEKIDDKFETFHQKQDAFDELILKEKAKLEDAGIEVPSNDKDEEPEKKKKHGLFRKNDDYTQSVEVLEEIAAALNQAENNDSFVTWEDEPKKEEVKEEKPKLSRMTITGLNLDSTYDFDDQRVVGKVPKEVVNEELEGSKVDELKEVLDDYKKEKNEKVKKHTFAKILIGILVFLIVVEIAIVAAKYFAPDSKFVEIIDQATASVVEFFGNLFKK